MNLCGILGAGGDREAPRETGCMFEPGNTGTVPRHQPQALGLFFQLLPKVWLDTLLWWSRFPCAGRAEMTQKQLRVGATGRFCCVVDEARPQMWEMCPEQGSAGGDGDVPARATSVCPCHRSPAGQPQGGVFWGGESKTRASPMLLQEMKMQEREMRAEAMRLPSADTPKPLALPRGMDEVSLAHVLTMCSLPH